MFYGLKEGKLNIQGVKMDYISFGKGNKPLILIHGLSTRGIKGLGLPLSFMYRSFAKEYKVYLFDRSKDLKKGVRIKDLAADLALAMDTFGLKKAHVVGVSLGGMIAQYLALYRPDLVTKLVLALTLSRNNDTIQKVIRNWIQLTEKGDFKSLTKDITEKTCSDSYIKRYRFLMPLLTFLQKPKDINRFIILAESCLSCDTYDDLKKIQCPVLVIGAEEDKIVTGRASIEMAKQLACELYMYKGLGHSATFEAKDFNQRIYDFLKA